MKDLRLEDCMTRVTDTILVEIVNIYQEMSLIELLEEENLMTASLHGKRFGVIQSMLRNILRSEIQRKLR